MRDAVARETVAQIVAEALRGMLEYQVRVSVSDRTGCSLQDSKIITRRALRELKEQGVLDWDRGRWRLTAGTAGRK